MISNFRGKLVLGSAVRRTSYSFSFFCGMKKKAKAVEKAAGKLSGKFLQPLFSMVAIYYSFQDSAGKLEASLGQRINEKDLVYAPRSGQLQAP